MQSKWKEDNNAFKLLNDKFTGKGSIGWRGRRWGNINVDKKGIDVYSINWIKYGILENLCH